VTLTLESLLSLAATPSSTQNSQAQRLQVNLHPPQVSIHLANRVRHLRASHRLCPLLVPLWSHLASQVRPRAHLLPHSLPFHQVQPQLRCQARCRQCCLQASHHLRLVYSQALSPHQLHQVSHHGIPSILVSKKTNLEALAQCFLSRRRPKSLLLPLEFTLIQF